MSGNRRRRGSLLLAGALLAGCYHSNAPRAWLGTARDMQHGANGGWILVRRDTGIVALETQGELLAADKDSVFVLTDSGRVSAIPTRQISLVNLETFRAAWSHNAQWTGFGVLSTASHGFFLILTAPTWLIVGTSATAAYSKAPVIKNATWEALAPYARFPQGMPAGIDRTRLTPPNHAR